MNSEISHASSISASAMIVSISDFMIDGNVVKMSAKKELTSLAEVKVPSSLSSLRSLSVVLPVNLFTEECHLWGSSVSKGLILSLSYYLLARLSSLTIWLRNLAEATVSLAIWRRQWVFIKFFRSLVIHG